MKLIVFCYMFIFFSLPLLAFPYHVEQEILDEVVQNEQRYELMPTANEVMFDLAMSYAYSGQILKGWKLLKQVPKEYSSTVISIYEQLMLEDETEWRYPFKCAFGYFFIGKKQHAIDLFLRVIAIKPDQVWAYGFIGLVYGEMGDADKAVEWCKKGLDIEPKATAIHFLLGEAYRKQKKYFKVLKQLLIVGRLQGQ
ncbi:MAG: hypothetical protein CL503_01580 [Actinobacteria bacterium]|nr:hypothetical protein [Actinomycetota bacterium]|tara:strand:+ start:1576 stop:2163 length:588 start_codon:yes stop_codon:yes gene_type:complete